MGEIAAADVPQRLADYETERAAFRIEVPERFNAVIDIVERWAAAANSPTQAWKASLGIEDPGVAAPITAAASTRRTPSP